MTCWGLTRCSSFLINQTAHKLYNFDTEVQHYRITRGFIDHFHAWHVSWEANITRPHNLICPLLGLTFPLIFDMSFPPETSVILTVHFEYSSVFPLFNVFSTSLDREILIPLIYYSLQMKNCATCIGNIHRVVEIPTREVYKDNTKMRG